MAEDAARTFQTRSLDEARGLYGARFMPIQVDLRRPRDRFHWRVQHTTIGALSILGSELAGGLRASAEPVESFYSLVRPLAQGVELTHGARVINVVPGPLRMLTSPTLPARFDFEPGHRGVQLSFPRELLEREAELLAGERLRGPLIFEPLIDGERAAPVLRLFDYILAEASAEESALSSPIVGARLSEALIHTLLRFQPHGFAALAAQGRTPPPRYLRLAEEYMAAHSDREITTAALCAAAGVGLRALQRAFSVHRGTTPKAFLRDRRIDVARARLLASPSLPITSVALSSGLAHLGRFSQAYRARFGESPRDTQRRARRR